MLLDLRLSMSRQMPTVASWFWFFFSGSIFLFVYWELSVFLVGVEGGLPRVDLEVVLVSPFRYNFQ